MSHLAELLQAAVDETRFDLGQRRAFGQASDTIFGGHPEHVVTPTELREILAQRPYHDEDVLRARSAQLIVSPGVLSQLIEHLETLLRDFIDPDSGLIGHAFPIGFSKNSHSLLRGDGVLLSHGTSTTDIFAKAMVRGAAILGSERISQLVDGWRQGQGTVVLARAILNDNGILSQTLNPLQGVQIAPLPLSTDELIGCFPTRSGVEPQDYLGRTAISIEHKVETVLYRPKERDRVRTSWKPESRVIDVPTVCIALALETDSYAEPALYWTDYRSLEACFLTGNRNTWHPSSVVFRSYLHSNVSRSTSFFLERVTTLKVDEKAKFSVDDKSLRTTILALAAATTANNRIATERWVSSKGPRLLVDKFIDLRIALEALYLKDIGDNYRGEMRFRLAIYGAWHLGSDSAERKRIRRVLLKAYDTASTAVHNGYVEWTTETKALLEEAQDLCRQGLFKFLREGHPKDWWNVILGGEIAGDQT